MLFWIISAILTFAVATAMLMPLWRGSRTLGPDAAGETAVYRDQLKELERDKAAGLIPPAEADYARAEIGRRLLAAAGSSAAAPATKAGRGGRHVIAQAFVLLCLPAIGLGLYLETGSPGLEAQPLAQRLAEPGNDVELLVTKVEQHLAQNPEDGAGWDVLAPIYFKAGRLPDAERAYRNALRLQGETPERLSGLGEVLIATNDGIVTEDARSAFEKSLQARPEDPRARFYLALSIEQSGRRDEAREAFEAIAAAAPADAPWLPLVNQHIAANGGAPLASGVATPPANPAAPGNPSEADIAATQAMSPEDRTAMVRGMVDSLDARLKQDPDNFEGWMRLVRSYAMLDEKDRAIEALKTGLTNFPATGEQGRQLIAMARQLGLPAEEAMP